MAHDVRFHEFVCETSGSPAFTAEPSDGDVIVHVRTGPISNHVKFIIPEQDLGLWIDDLDYYLIERLREVRDVVTGNDESED